MANIRRFTFIFALLLISISIFGQIKVKELPTSKTEKIDSVFFDVNEFRSINNLRDGWVIYAADAPEKKVSVTIPSTFSGVESLIYERSIFISKEKVKSKNLTLHFLGINYTADVLFNDMVIYKHPGGTQPFNIEIPSDLIIPESDNKLTVKVQYGLDDVNTIPLLQRFLFPDSKGGILGEIYLAETNKSFINIVRTSYILNTSLNSAALQINTTIQNNEIGNGKSIAENEHNYILNYRLVNGESEFTFEKQLGKIKPNESISIDTELNVTNPVLWSPQNPNSYTLDLELSVNDSVIDKTSKSISFFDARINAKQIILNGNEFNIKGTTYFYYENDSGGLVSFDKLRTDLELIKQTGFNTVRFAKLLPPAYALRICESIGLFALIELPLNSVPDQILAQSDFSNRVTNHINLMLDQYSNYSSVLAVGLGGGFIGTNADQQTFLTIESKHLKEVTNKLTYASFTVLPSSKIGSLDLFGQEFFSINESGLAEEGNKYAGYDFPVFISEATYPSFKGNSNGYLNDNSYEAAAKYYSDIIDFAKTNKLNGFVINTFYDYKGEFKSFYTGYNEEFIYSIGLLPNSETIDRISYKVVKSKLTDSEKITIPIGTAKDDSPILFVIIGLVLSILMALLINSKRKFREDAGRALIRPYNFFADIRDHRLLSGLQTNLLMFILAGSFSLLAINMLYFLKTNLHLEKILLSFGSATLIDWIIYLAWHPLNGFLILFGIMIVGILLISTIIKLFSFFLKNKVFFSSIYYSVIWALLPLSLLLPLELVLYRVLAADVVNLYIYVFIIIYLLWLGQRLLKGVHVIFDVRPATVHLYGILLILFLVGGVLLYFQFTNSTIYYLIRVVSEYQFL